MFSFRAPSAGQRAGSLFRVLPVPPPAFPCRRPRPTQAKGGTEDWQKNKKGLARQVKRETDGSLRVVQAVTQRLLRRGGIQTKLASVHEQRASSTDTSQKKAGLQCTNLSSDGKVTLLDLGITHPLIDTNISIKPTEERGFAAHKYGVVEFSYSAVRWLWQHF